MKVLSLGPIFGQTPLIAKSFRSQKGHEIRTLACVGFSPLADTADYLFQPGEPVSEILRRISPEWSPDVLVSWLPELVPPPLGIEHCPLPTVAIVSDWSLRYPCLAYNLSRFDLVLVDKKGATFFRPVGVVPEYRFPLYSHWTEVHQDQGLERDIDILFVGSLNSAIHGERSRLLERIAAAPQPWHVEIRDGVFGAAYAALLNRAKIVVNYTLRGEMNLRCLEATACGALLFIEETNWEIGDWFRPGLEVVLYNEQNILPLLQRYLKDDTERSKVAQAGKERAMRLAGETRLDDVLDIFAALEPSERPYLNFREHDKQRADISLYSFDMETPMGAWAEYCLQKAAEEDSQNALAAAALGFRAYHRSLRADPETRQQELGAALHWSKEACRRRPELAVFHYNLAVVCRACGLNDQAIGFIDAARKSNDCEDALFLYGEMTNAGYTGWLKALSEGSASADMLRGMGAALLAAILLDKCQWVEALESASFAESLGHRTRDVYLIRAAALERLGDTRQATEELEKALALSAFDYELRMRLAQAYAKTGRMADLRKLVDESGRIFSRVPHLTECAEIFSRLLPA
ncbi:MAG TPA: glycosyltransferase [Candidatus Hydrogenedentes bacterium]|nr:glycosyltransferase [Candidatus Hydrogenedentota bacterium]HOL76096.1 glycosyltransferase [Candidatus Hydrogenedentota bacterium]HPO84710.1 glycosyltransferase [Candidatus Hydrogenedentota bacterium]